MEIIQYQLTIKIDKFKVFFIQHESTEDVSIFLFLKNMKLLYNVIPK
jgi:hypothetical protein